MLPSRQQRLTGDNMGQRVRAGNLRRQFVIRKEDDDHEPLPVVVVLDVTWGRGAITSGPPERCRPDEGVDWFVLDVLDQMGNSIEASLTKWDHTELRCEIEFLIEEGTLDDY